MARKSRTSSLLFTLACLVAIALCVRLGFWQFDRYEFRHQLTAEINSALDEKPISLTNENQKSARPWMKVTITGSYDKKAQTLFRGHYFQERYGLEVLSLFIPTDEEIPPIWVDRGWIETNKSAATDISIPEPPSGNLAIAGILKKYDDAAESKGIFFALPAPRIGRIDEPSLQKIYSGETFFAYLKLNRESGGNALGNLQITPLTPPGTGPHLAYAIQWWLFALLIAGTRLALYRGERSL